jgi:hypothetical protein
MRFLTGVLALLVTACWLLPAQSSSKRASTARNKAAAPAPDPPPSPIEPSWKPSPEEKLTFDVEWRLIHAGTVVIESRASHAQMRVESAGLVSSLFKVNNTYSVDYDEHFCASSSLMDAREGKRHRETAVTYDGQQNRATLLERDLIKNTVIQSTEIDIPSCVNDVLGGLLHLRTLNLEPGQSAQLSMSDGRRSSAAKAEAQEREELTTPAGKFRSIRYEAHLLNGVIYSRKGRAFVWLSDDARRLPVQIRLRMQFPIGTVTLQLQKEEHL